MNVHATATYQQQIWDTLLIIDKALVQKDAIVLEKLLSADFIGAIPTGASFQKSDYINRHCNGKFGIIDLTEEDMDTASIRLFNNNTAVVNRKAHTHFKLPTGQVLEYDVQRIEVLVKVNGEWIMVSGQGTQVAPAGL